MDQKYCQIVLYFHIHLSLLGSSSEIKVSIDQMLFEWNSGSGTSQISAKTSLIRQNSLVSNSTFEYNLIIQMERNEDALLYPFNILINWRSINQDQVQYNLDLQNKILAEWPAGNNVLEIKIAVDLQNYYCDVVLLEFRFDDPFIGNRFHLATTQSYSMFFK